MQTHLISLERRPGLVHKSCAPQLAQWWGADLVERAGPILCEDGHEQAVQPERKVANLGASGHLSAPQASNATSLLSADESQMSCNATSLLRADGSQMSGP